MKTWILGAVLFLGVATVLCFTYFTGVYDKRSEAAKAKADWLRK